jgi:hypothetical protein
MTVPQSSISAPNQGLRSGGGELEPLGPGGCAVERLGGHRALINQEIPERGLGPAQFADEGDEGVAQGVERPAGAAQVGGFGKTAGFPHGRQRSGQFGVGRESARGGLGRGWEPAGGGAEGGEIVGGQGGAERVGGGEQVGDPFDGVGFQGGLAGVVRLVGVGGVDLVGPGGAVTGGVDHLVQLGLRVDHQVAGDHDPFAFGQAGEHLVVGVAGPAETQAALLVRTRTVVHVDDRGAGGGQDGGARHDEGVGGGQADAALGVEPGAEEAAGSGRELDRGVGEFDADFRAASHLDEGRVDEADRRLERPTGNRRVVTSTVWPGWSQAGPVRRRRSGTTGWRGRRFRRVFRLP